MAIVREGSAVQEGTAAILLAAGGSLGSFNVQCGTNASRAVHVMLAADVGGSRPAPSGASITCGGNAMTALGAQVSVGGTHAGRVWEYINPGTGNQAIVVTYPSGSIDGDGVVIAVCHSGVHQTDPSLNYNTASSTSGANADLTVTSQVGDTVICFTFGESGSWTTDDAGASKIVQADTNEGGGGVSGSASTRAGASPNVATQHTPSSAGNWGVLGFSLTPAAAASAHAGVGGINHGLVGRGLVNGGLLNRSMTKINGIWQQSKEIVRPRLIVPVGIQLQGAR